jgi:hypothetical protein
VFICAASPQRSRSSGRAHHRRELHVRRRQQRAENDDTVRGGAVVGRSIASEAQRELVLDHAARRQLGHQRGGAQAQAHDAVRQLAVDLARLARLAAEHDAAVQLAQRHHIHHQATRRRAPLRARALVRARAWASGGVRREALCVITLFGLLT